MDLEEQRLKQRIEMREEALKEKVNTLKKRFDRLKHMSDVKAKVEERPGLMFMGSILAGFVTKKWANGKNHNSKHTYRENSRKNFSPMSASTTGGLWNPVGAIISAIVTRAAVGIGSEIVRSIMPRKHKRSDRNFNDN